MEEEEEEEEEAAEEGCFVCLRVFNNFLVNFNDFQNC